ncbi:WbqC family protein [Lysinibacillus sp. KU-BSD001]|uniref:WbqC family protein n=1 Tax=Lysinibacillus sp. KU-BSD001 TaxID=3141328 RepID=UPI0036E2C6DC
MKVAIHQPNYLPWIGYFDKMDQVDRFVILDKADHSKSGYINRSKIKTPNGSLMLTVPLQNKEQPIHALQIATDQKWQMNHWKAIEANYKKSPYWLTYKDGFEQLYQGKWTHLAPFNIALIQHIQSLLNIRADILLESDFQQDFGSKNERNINIVAHLGGDVYLSGIGARAYNDESKFHERQIQLIYQDFTHPIYPQRWGEFLPNLSIIDMLFHCGPETMNMIRQQRAH